jgi:O-6-methylguanine DNA methyltransferase
MKTVLKGQITVRYAPVSTPIGRLYVAYRGRTVCHVMVAATDRAFERAGAKRLDARPVREDRLPRDLVSQVVDHLRGKRRFQGELALNGLTPFQRLVLEKTREIPSGEVRSYQWVAREIGAERAVRAVGTALAKNPIPFLIPCHRVVRTDGHIGRYSAGGSTMKAKLLAFEGIDVEGLSRLARRRIRFVGNDVTRTFCLPTCEVARRARTSQAVYLPTLRDATRRGYRACRRCRPI